MKKAVITTLLAISSLCLSGCGNNNKPTGEQIEKDVFIEEVSQLEYTSQQYRIKKITGKGTIKATFECPEKPESNYEITLKGQATLTLVNEQTTTFEESDYSLEDNVNVKTKGDVDEKTVKLFTSDKPGSSFVHPNYSKIGIDFLGDAAIAFKDPYIVSRYGENITFYKKPFQLAEFSDIESYSSYLICTYDDKGLPIKEDQGFQYEIDLGNDTLSTKSTYEMHLKYTVEVVKVY